MQSRLELRRSPTGFIAILFALAVTLLLGGTLGYVIKPATSVGPTRTIYVPSNEPSSNFTQSPCQLVNHQKAC